MCAAETAVNAGGWLIQGLQSKDIDTYNHLHLYLTTRSQLVHLVSMKDLRVRDCSG
jgi:hypothetical protein